MKQFFRLALIAIITISFASCKNDEGSIKWGKTKYYNDSFLKKYEPVVMSKTLEFSLNEDAQYLRDTEFSFEIFEEMPNGKKMPASDIIIYKNGVRCPNNILCVKGNEEMVELGIEFTPGATEGHHKFFLKEKALNGLDRIEYISIGNGFYAEKAVIMNPGNKLAMLIGIAIIALYLLYVLILRPIFAPHLRFSKVFITYPGNSDEVCIRTNGYCKLLLSNKPIKQSFLRKLFFVENKVEVNELWTSPVTIESGRNPYIRVRTRLDIDPSPLDTPERKEKFIIYNDDNQKIGIETT